MMATADHHQTSGLYDVEKAVWELLQDDPPGTRNDLTVAQRMGLEKHDRFNHSQAELLSKARIGLPVPGSRFADLSLS